MCIIIGMLLGIILACVGLYTVLTLYVGGPECQPKKEERLP